MQQSDDFKSRYSKAKRFRDAERPFIEEVLSYCRPGREKDFSRTDRSTSADDTDRFIDIPEELADDLAGDLVSYFTPSELSWFEYEVDGSKIPEEVEDDVLEIVKAREEGLRGLLEGSNYYDIAPQWGFEAASHGTPALWVDKGHLTQPIHFEVVPPNELLIVPGYLGILDRFREATVQSSSLPALLGPGVDLSHEKIQKKIKKPGEMSKVCWGFWVNWSDPGNPVWHHEICVDGEKVSGDPLLGPLAGACPLLVGRFNPQPGRPWGRGAGRRALPSMRVSDQLAEDVLSAADQSLRRTLIYPDDGYLDLSEGIEAGRAYPASSGFTRDQVFDLSRDVNVDQGFFSEERQEQRLRRLFYQDQIQRGDTPPTLGQYMDERRRIHQRVGRISAPLWTELFIPMLQRIENIAVQIGTFEQDIIAQGQIVSAKLISPLQTAQNLDKVNVTRANLDLGVTVFGEAFAQVVDPIKTFQNIIKTSGDELTVVQEQQDAPAAPPV